MFPLVPLLWSTALAAPPALPARAARQATRIQLAAQVAWASCAEVPVPPDSPEPACIGAFLADFEGATVRARGQDWPVFVPEVDAAHARRDVLALDAAEAELRARAGTAWQALDARTGAPDEALVADLSTFLAEYGPATVQVGAATRPVDLPELAAAESALERATLAARLVALEPPPWDGRFAEGGAPTPPPRLVQRSARRNQIIDDQKWFEEVDWVLPVVRASAAARNWRLPTLPDEAAGPAPRVLGGLPAHHFIVDGDAVIGLYGTGTTLTLVGLFDAETGTLRRAFDFSHWVRAPRARQGDEDFVEQSIRWAAVRDGVLYVNHDHRTYAASSYGHNAYLTALDLETGRLLWRSAPLVAGVGDFVVAGDWILSGYGFTAEPDYLYVLDRHTGRTVDRVKLKTGPDWLLLRDDTLYVRTYDMDYVFALQR